MADQSRGWAQVGGRLVAHTNAPIPRPESVAIASVGCEDVSAWCVSWQARAQVIRDLTPIGPSFGAGGEYGSRAKVYIEWTHGLRRCMFADANAGQIVVIGDAVNIRPAIDDSTLLLSINGQAGAMIPAAAGVEEAWVATITAEIRASTGPRATQTADSLPPHLSCTFSAPGSVCVIPYGSRMVQISASVAGTTVEFVMDDGSVRLIPSLIFHANVPGEARFIRISAGAGLVTAVFEVST